MELVNQSVCDSLLNPSHDLYRGPFNPDLMICAGDVEDGGRDTCSVAHHHACINVKENWNISISLI